jgi:hypothetical protein
MTIFTGAVALRLLSSASLSWVPAGKYERFDLKCSNRKRVLQELARFQRWFK